MIRRACLAALTLAGGLAGAQQPRVVVGDPGPGPVGHYLARLLARPDTRVIVGDTVTVARDSTYPGSVVVIGKRGSVTGTVHGDVVVVGGDLFLEPGGDIAGQGIAIGGGAHTSLLGTTGDGLVSYRDFTFDAEPTTTGLELRYRDQYAGARRSLFELPALYGLRIPSYDRSNGLSLPVGPTINLGPLTLDAVATYRSQLGRVDPTLAARIALGRATWISAFAGRETRTNDDWINGRLSNSLNSLLSGHDERNWYRATGARATLNRTLENPVTVATYSLGASFERARAVRPDANPTGGPWSFIDRADAEEGMFRPNPQVAGGDITSIVGGAAYRWTAGTIKARLDLDVEAPVNVSNGPNFVQGTVDGRIEFPTFGAQRYRFDVHGVGTSATPPGQRFVYLGGGGSLPTVEPLLSIGGDELLFIENRYEVPVPRVQLPFVGAPTLAFRHILGSAGLQRLPDFTQVVGLRLSVLVAHAQWMIDTGTRKTKLSASLSLSR
jgi:hypothetical protein